MTAEESWIRGWPEASIPDNDADAATPNEDKSASRRVIRIQGDLRLTVKETLPQYVASAPLSMRLGQIQESDLHILGN
jgi:hypothetical protein